MFSKIGILAILGGGFVWVFSGISRFMQADNFWVDVTLSSVLGDFSDTIVDSVSIEIIHDFLFALFFEFHLGTVLIGFGLLFLLISLFVKNH